MVIVSVFGQQRRPEWAQNLPSHNADFGMHTSTMAKLGYGRKRYSSVMDRPGTLLLKKNEDEAREAITGEEAVTRWQIKTALPMKEVERLRRRLAMKEFVSGWDLLTVTEINARKQVYKAINEEIANIRTIKVTRHYSSVQTAYGSRIQRWAREIKERKHGLRALRKDLFELRRKQARRTLETTRKVVETADSELRTASRVSRAESCLEAVMLLIRREALARRLVHDEYFMNLDAILRERTIIFTLSVLENAWHAVLRIEVVKRAAIEKQQGIERFETHKEFRMQVLALDSNVKEATRQIVRWWRECKKGTYSITGKKVVLCRSLKVTKRLLGTKKPPLYKPKQYKKLTSLLAAQGPKPPTGTVSEKRPESLRSVQPFAQTEKTTAPFTPFLSLIHTFESDCEYTMHAVQLHEHIVRSLLLASLSSITGAWAIHSHERYRRLLLVAMIKPKMLLLHGEGSCYVQRVQTKSEEGDARGLLRMQYYEDKRRSLGISIATLQEAESNQRETRSEELFTQYVGFLATLSELTTSRFVELRNIAFQEREAETRSDLEYTQRAHFMYEMTLPSLRSMMRARTKEEYLKRGEIVVEEGKASNSLFEMYRSLMDGEIKQDVMRRESSRISTTTTHSTTLNILDEPVVATSFKSVLQALVNRECDRRAAVMVLQDGIRASAEEKWHAASAEYLSRFIESMCDDEEAMRVAVLEEQQTSRSTVITSILSSMTEHEDIADRSFTSGVIELEICEANHRGRVAFQEDEDVWFLADLSRSPPITHERICTALHCCEQGNRLSIERSWVLQAMELFKPPL